MSSLWCVRAEFGTYTSYFVKGGFVGIGWMPDTNLGAVTTREELYPLYKAAHPNDTSKIVIGQQVGQISRFLLEMAVGDHVITPAADTEWLHYGKLTEGPSASSYFYAAGDDGCPYRHRRHVTWAKQRLRRGDLSVPFQNTIRSSLTVFSISQIDEFLVATGQAKAPTTPAPAAYDPYRAVLDQVLQLDDKEFEILVGHLLTALGFEGSEVTGKSGDGGVDATGELIVANLAKVKVFVQAKRYKLGTNISGKVVKQLRQAIPFGGQGAFITTADFQKGAHDVALEPGFPRIGLLNGRQLVDLLVKNWDDIPTEFQEQLGLRRGLVRGPVAASGGRADGPESSLPSAGGTLADIIRAGLLAPPVKLFRRYKGKRLEATLRADGAVEFQGQRYGTCSGAAEAARATISGRQMTTNGWTFWQYQDAGGKKLTLRDARHQVAHPTGAGASGQKGPKDQPERHHLRKKFWQALLDRPKMKGTRHADIAPGVFSWIGAGSGVRRLPFVYAIGQGEGHVELHIDRGPGTAAENKDIFDRLRQHKDEIDKAFGSPLSWERLDDKQGSRIAYTLTDGGYRSDESKWPAIQDAMIDAMGRLEKALAPHLEKLKTELTS